MVPFSLSPLAKISCLSVSYLFVCLSVCLSVFIEVCLFVFLLMSLFVAYKITCKSLNLDDNLPEGFNLNLLGWFEQRAHNAVLVIAVGQDFLELGPNSRVLLVRVEVPPLTGASPVPENGEISKIVEVIFNSGKWQRSEINFNNI